MKCDHLRKGMDKYSILANEDMSTIVILDEDMPEFAVEINTKDMSMLVRIQVSENKEHNTVIGKDSSVKDEIELMISIITSGVDPIEAVGMLAFCQIFSEKVNIEKSLDSVLDMSELFEDDDRLHNQPMQSIMIH